MINVWLVLRPEADIGSSALPQLKVNEDISVDDLAIFSVSLAAGLESQDLVRRAIGLDDAYA